MAHPIAFGDSTPTRRYQGQAAASGGGCLATSTVVWLGESGNIIWRLLLGARAPTNVRKILDVTWYTAESLWPGCDFIKNGRCRAVYWLQKV